MPENSPRIRAFQELEAAHHAQKEEIDRRVMVLLAATGDTDRQRAEEDVKGTMLDELRVEWTRRCPGRPCPY